MQPAYRYRAELVRVIDADTLLLAIDLGFRASLRVPIRLRGWNAAERNTKRGQKAIRFVEELLAACEDVVVETYKDRQSFARWVADVWTDGELLGERLEREGLAVPVGDRP